jgi:signal transduction histidine kinase/ABC-type sugar transport system substrate-binding protein/AraC-like DNA-binding protein
MAKNKSISEIRVGTLLGPHDPFWVQVREAVYKAVQQQGMTLVPLELFESLLMLVSLDNASLAEELLAENLDVLISQEIPFQVVQQMLDSGIPVVYLSESERKHPLYVSLRGLYEAAQMVGEYVAEKLHGRGKALCVGGLLEPGEDKGISRIRGFMDALRKYPDIAVMHYPANWRYEDALPLIESFLKGFDSPFQAIFGISDSLALAGRDAAQKLGILKPDTVVIGINGDPLALSAIAEGTMSATVETSAVVMAERAVEVAMQAALGESFPSVYNHKLRLITQENVAEVALEKLTAIANIPSRLVGVNFQQGQNRLRQLQLTAELNQRLGTLLERRQLAREMADLLRENYKYDLVQIYLWKKTEGMLVQERDGLHQESLEIPISEAGILGDAIQKREPVYIPDTHFSQRYPPDPRWPETRTRVALPVIFGNEIFAVVDLHQYHTNPNVREEVFGLRFLADYLGVVFRNADLYTDALNSREAAEKANQLKTRLLASVSHELRTPLNVILGYSQSALSTPNPYHMDLPDDLRQDLQYIFQSGNHLQRIINDLLDLSRAEIGELELVPEVIDTHRFLEDTFNNMASHPASSPGVAWTLALPARLPVIQADPVRLRQIIMNLLNNASKFTDQGEICLGAEVEPPHLHLWVRDTGLGIPFDAQDRIFEPFRTVNQASWRQREGIGLGLNITRQLVLLHGGSMLLESQPGCGSTFHIYFPLPNLAGGLSLPVESTGRRVMAVVSAQENLPKEVLEICRRQRLDVYPISASQNLDELWKSVQPAALAWDLSSASLGDWNLLQSLRNQAQFSRLPVLLFSQEECQLEGGITNILFKPLNSATLGEYLEGILPQDVHGAIWIVDDDPLARQLYQRLVEKAFPGHALRLAEDGAQALALLEQEIPGLVILDLLMPQVDGFQVLARLRCNPATCRVPVVVISGKLLTFEDIQRLNYMRVTFQTKHILTEEETILALQQSFSGEGSLSQPTSLLVKQSLAYLHQNYPKDLSRRELAQAVGVTENYLSQIFRQELGITPWECLNRLRILRAKEYLMNSEQSITEIACQVGYNDPAYFSRVFKKILGISPQAYRTQPKITG